MLRIMDEAELKDRTKQFALRCMKLADSLPHNYTGRTIAGQLARCGSSVGSNYRAACRSRSRAEFVAKLGVVEEEADESAFWMELIVASGMKPLRVIESLRSEADELTRIIAASIKTARWTKTSNPKSAIQNRKSP
jgi:four helix bundle protein